MVETTLSGSQAPGAGRLDGKIALITGASSGFGRQFAQALAGAGAAVAVTARRADRIDALAAEINDGGGRAMAVAMDVTDLGSIDAAVGAAEDRFGPISVLVNNAGVSAQKPIVEMTEEDYDFVMDTNAKGAYFVAQRVARRMIEKGEGGRIINVASAGALKVLNQLSVYCMSKAAMAHMTRTMALEWARYDINVNAICPGYIETEMNAHVWKSEPGQRLIQTFPRRRLGDITDLDGIVLLLASDDSRFINGTVIPVDDGYTSLS